MPERVARLWRTLAVHCPLRWTRMDFLEEFGPDVLLWSERVGVAVKSSLDGWRIYDCGGARPGCEGRTVLNINGWFASCPHTPPGCETISFTDSHQVVVDLGGLVPFLQRALGVAHERSPKLGVAQLGVVPLGSKRLANRDVDFVFVADPRDERVESWFSRATADARRAIAAITFDRGEAPAELPAQDQVEWLFLADALPTPNGLIPDLTGVLERFVPDALDGSLLWPRYLFVVDKKTERVWFAGKRLKFPNDETRLLLLDLLQHPNEPVPLEQLLPKVYRGRKRIALDSLRKVKSRLVGLLEEICQETGATLPLEHEGDGPGYELTVPPGSIRWLQTTSRTSADPPADL